MKIAVIGAGSWGTTLADLLAKKGVPTTLWVREPELLAEMKEKGRNTWFLPDLDLSPELQLHANPARAFAGAKVFLLVVPSQFMRASLESFRDILPKKPIMVCASKGIENNTLAPMSQVVAEALEALAPRYAALSGPSFAKEVSLGMPTTVSLNSIMVDGIGMCGACRVRVDDSIRFACVDGPEFDAHKVDFGELMMRLGSYVPQEKQSYKCYCECHGKES